MRVLVRAIAATVGVSLCAIGALAESDLERQLNDEYQGKTLVLLGFYSGDRLSYDSAGTLVRTASSGEWTSDGFVRIEHLHLSHNHLTIEAKRLLVIQLDEKNFQLHPDRDLEKRPLKIEADLESLSIQAADATMAKIFLTAQDQFADLVSDYWKPCVRKAATGKDQIFGFSSELLGVPGVAAAESDSVAATEESSIPPVNCGVKEFGTKRGVHPTVIYSPNPEFTEKARRAKYQGFAVVALVVNEEGLPQNIRIIEPLGFGLDEKALSCVKKWRFKPAEKDGHALAMQISVEVDFHLY